MSGVVFNGVEMKNNESVNDYIQRVLEEQSKKLEYVNIHSSDESESSDSSDNEEVSETDDSDTEDEHGGHYKLYKKVILGTYDCNIEEHDDAIRFFNNKYGTLEKGSNGSKGHYWTHGETNYNLFELPKLRKLYDREIKSVRLYNIKICISFLDCEGDPKPDYKENQERINLLRNFRSQRDLNKYIILKDCFHFNDIINLKEVRKRRDYNSHVIIPNDYNYMVNNGIILAYNKNNNLYFYEVEKVYKNKIKCKALKPITTIIHNVNNSYDNKTVSVKLVKFVKSVYTDEQESIYIHKINNNKIYVMDDYIYTLHKTTLNY